MPDLKNTLRYRTGIPPSRPEATVTDVPDGLKARGLALWASLGQVDGTAQGAVALEACRMADRLDELDSVIQGKGVLNLMRFRVLSDYVKDDTVEVNVRVEFSQVLAEARQQQATLKQLLTGLESKGSAGRKGSPLDELAKRRSAGGSRTPRARRTESG